MIKSVEVKKLRKQKSEILEGVYKEAFKEMKDYISLDVLRGADLERALLEVLDVLLKAQSKRKKLDSYTGKNHKEYCDSIIMKYTCGGSFLYRLASRVELVIAFTTGTMLASYLVSNLFYKLNFGMDLSLFLYCLMINFAVSAFIPIISSYQRKKTYERFSTEIVKPGRSLITSLGILYLSYFAFSYVMQKTGKFFYGKEIGPLGMIVMVAALGAAFVLIKRYRNSCRIKYESNQKNSGNYDLADGELNGK